jgi:hypothetical protein
MLDLWRADLERAAVIEALLRHRGIVRRAAQWLILSRRRVYDLIAIYVIDVDAIRTRGREAYPKHQWPVTIGADDKDD